VVHEFVAWFAESAASRSLFKKSRFGAIYDSKTKMSCWFPEGLGVLQFHQCRSEFASTDHVSRLRLFEFSSDTFRFLFVVYQKAE
jgi:hypothetical protein